MNDKDVFTVGQSFDSIFRNIDRSKMQSGLTISDVWEETITKIYKYGPKLAGHTNVVDLKNGILLVETDHPGWNQILQSHKDFIMKGLKMNVKDIEINTIAFRVRGTERGLSENYEEAKEREKNAYLKQMEADEKRLEQMGFTDNRPKEEVPDEVKKLFEGIFDSE